MKARALIYPRCIIKKKLAYLLAPFFEEAVVICPSKADEKKITKYSQDLPIDVIPLITPTDDMENERFQAWLKALESWGQQMGLGDTVTFETFYSAMNSAEDQEVRQLISTLKGTDSHDMLLAARMFLALSIDFDLRQDELEEEMAIIEQKSQKLRSLVDEGDLLDDKSNITDVIEPLSKAKERLSAWIRIAILMDDIDRAMPLGESIAVKDLLDTAYEKLLKQPVPPPLFEIKLPCREKCQKNKGLLKRTQPIFKQIISRLVPGKGELNHEEVIELAQELKELFDEYIESDEPVNATLVLADYRESGWIELASVASKLQPSINDKKGQPYSFFIL